MKDLEYISSQVSKGKNLNINLDKYGKGMASMYHDLSLVKLSMNYYTIYDMNQDEDCTEPLYLDIYNQLNGIIKDYLANKIDISVVEALRQEVTNIMDVVVALIDRMRIYEHVLNRVEYRFKEGKTDNSYYNNYLTNDLMHYILSHQDNVVINTKIAEVVGQLPMRLSKNKFFSYMKEAFSLYHGAQKGTIDDFDYSLRTTAMLTVPLKYNDCLDTYKKLVDMLAKADYDNIDASQYNELYQSLTKDTQKINELADSFVLLTQIINDLYSAVLMRDYDVEPTTETALAVKIIDIINQSALLGTEVPKDLAESFAAFEGVQERLLSVIEKNEYVLDEVFEMYEDKLKAFGERELFEALKNAAKLQSGSNFVKLRADSDYATVPDASYADAVCERLIFDLQAAFKAWSQPVRRAVMASVFSQLPVLFNNTEEIHSYINVSLMQCTDEAERIATIEILKSIMEGFNL